MPEAVKVEGLARLEATMAQLAQALPTTAPPEAARIIGQVARLNVPKRTGRLASSWASESGEGAQGLSFGNAAVRYAAPIHWGVGARPGLRGPHNIRPSLYLLRAVESTQRLWEETYSRDISTQLGKVRGA